MLGRASTVSARNPLLLSGIVLAGANQMGTGAATNRGIFTAEEVAELDLSGTELVVLSACETGLGEVAGGEGVFGLQRAFGLAGRAVVASLWKIEDDATRVLMSEFYRALWDGARPVGKAEALRRAQQAMIRRYDASRRTLIRGTERKVAGGDTRTNAPLHPFFWAAFTLDGDWR